MTIMKRAQSSTLPRIRAQRGVTLIEAMVALVIMSFGMVALVGLMGNLRRGGDVAKQRSEAMRLAQAELATLRSFSVIQKPVGAAPSVHDYENDLVAADARSVVGENSNTTFVVSRNVTPLVPGGVEPQARTVSVTVTWKDRADADESLTLHSVISRTDPAFSGALGVVPPANGLRMPDTRHPAIPVGAKNLGNGSSGFRPSGGGSALWVFNNLTGVITGKCSLNIDRDLSSLTVSDVESCKNNTIGYLLSGTIRFSNTSPANPTTPEGTALPLSVRLSLAESQFTEVKDGREQLVPGREYPISPNFECFSDAPPSAPSAQTFVNYNCIVYPNNQTPRNWWGTVLLSDLKLGTGADQYKVCRYSADYNGNGYVYDVATGRIDNEEHPAFYRGVSYSLVRQNFLVIRGNVACPAAPAPDPTVGIFVDYSTVQLQP